MTVALCPCPVSQLEKPLCRLPCQPPGQHSAPQGVAARLPELAGERTAPAMAHSDSWEHPRHARAACRHGLWGSVCYVTGPSRPLLQLPPACRQLLDSGRRLSRPPSGSLPVRVGSQRPASSVGRGALAACSHGGTKPVPGCPAALPAAACGPSEGRRRRSQGLEAAALAQRPPQWRQARPRH